MPSALAYEILADKSGLLTVTDPKFKRNRLSVNLVVPMQAEHLSNRAAVPQLLRHGCEGLPDFTHISRRLDMLYGASLYADVGKIGANQIITLSVSSLDERYTYDNAPLSSDCAALLRDVLLFPFLKDGVFDPANVAVEKKNLIDTIEAEINDKRGYAISRCLTLMGQGDPSALRRLGTVEDCKKITPSSVTEAWRYLLANSRIELAAIGPGGDGPAREILFPALNNLVRTPVSAAVSQPIAACDSPRYFTEELDVLQAKLVLGYRMGGSADPATTGARRIMSALLGGTPFSKLFLNLRERLSLCYYCAARYDRINAMMLIDVGLDQNNIEPAKEEIAHQLQAIQKGDFTDEDLQNTCLLIKNSLRAVTDSTGTLEEWYLNRTLTGSLQTPAEELAIIDAVTREQVIAAAKAVSLDTVYLLTSKEA
jgi:predicted Zn-dependent peptidase